MTTVQVGKALFEIMGTHPMSDIEAAEQIDFIGRRLRHFKAIQEVLRQELGLDAGYPDRDTAEKVRAAIVRIRSEGR